MRVNVLLLSIFMSVIGTLASAQAFVRCSDDQQSTILQILPGASDLATRAAAAVGNTTEFTRWFGIYDERKAEAVRSNLKSIDRALRSEALRFYCGHTNEPACAEGSYAYVYTSEHYAMTLCPLFFTMPMMPGGSSKDADYEHGTMEGTIIHEMSHFDVTAGTDDLCYSRQVCQQMALNDPQSTIYNADTYQYFTEDVSFAIAAALNGNTDQ